MIRTISLLIIVQFLITSCGSWKKIQLDEYVQDSNCFQIDEYDYRKEDLPLPVHLIDIDTILLNNFSINSINIAHAFGFREKLENYLISYIEFMQDAEVDVMERIDLLDVRQRLNQHINLASIEVSAIASEMDCEEERFDQIASFLGRKEDRTERNLTVGAIVTGALGTIVSAVIILNDPDDNRVEYAGIGTGLIEVVLGTLLLTNKRKVYISHKRNALRDLWEGQSVSSIYPIPIWYYLNYFNPDDSEESRRNQILEKWLKFGQISESRDRKKDKLIDLYFKDGGYYTSEQLENRANMHDQIESQINLMKQELKSLALELEYFENKFKN